MELGESEGDVNIVVDILPPGFNEEHGDVGVLSESIGQHTACSATPHYDVIIVIKPLNWPEKKERKINHLVDSV